MEKNVKDIMTKTIQVCQVDSSIPEVAHIMNTHDVSAVIVLDEQGHLAGIVTRTDMVQLRGFDEYWYGMTASHIMKRDVVTCEPDIYLREASKILIQRKVHRLVVVEPVAGTQSLRPVGVLSQTDIVRDMATYKPSERT